MKFDISQQLARKNRKLVCLLVGLQRDAMKAQAIHDLMFELIAKGKPKAEVADILGVKRNTIYRWLRAGNISLPARGPRLGNRSMNELQEQALIDRIKSNPSMAQRDLKRHIRDE